MGLIGHIKFQKKLDRVAGVAEQKKLWGRIGFQAIDIITQRTLKGKDVDGAAFTPYSRKAYFFNFGSKENPNWKTLKFGYAEFKRIKGGSAHGRVVNLSLDGNMLASMKAKSTNRNTTLFFSKTEEAKKAFYHHKGKGRNPKREFFDLSRMEEKKLLVLFRRELKELIG